MRFSAAVKPKQILPNRLMAQVVGRRFNPGQPDMKSPPALPRAEDLPAALDERVRLIGEW